MSKVQNEIHEMLGALDGLLFHLTNRVTGLAPLQKQLNRRDGLIETTSLVKVAGEIWRTKLEGHAKVEASVIETLVKEVKPPAPKKQKDSDGPFVIPG